MKKKKRGKNLNDNEQNGHSISTEQALVQYGSDTRSADRVLVYLPMTP